MIMGFTKPIEHFNLQRKKVITMNTLYVGIDVSSKSNVVYLMLPNGDKHSNFSVANSHEGSTLLVKKIYSALTSHSLDTVLIGLEATSVYGDNLVYHGSAQNFVKPIISCTRIIDQYVKIIFFA